MFYDNYKSNEYDFNECSSKGSCSIAPNVSSIQEIILVLLKEIAYYVKNLKQLNQDLSKFELGILHALSEFISVAEYTDDKVWTALMGLNKSLTDLYKTFSSVSKITETMNFINLDKASSLSEIISLGENLYLQRINKLSSEEKFYSEILLLNLKSLSINILKLTDYEIINQKAINLIINGLNLYNLDTPSIEQMENAINELTATENEILKERAKIQIETFGEITETVVPTSSRKNKAVLVSGSSLKDLYSFLEYTKDIEGLDVYSHGDLLIAHAFEKFKKFPHFVGHYGTSNENCIFDFATFPGAILLTKHSNQNIEHLIRGRIFTMDTVQPKGAIKIDNEEFDKIVESAFLAKGFKKGQIRNDVVTGFNETELDSQIETIYQQLQSNKIRKILIIGMSPKSTLQEIYLNDILDNLTKDIFIISFSKITTNLEHLEINIANNFPLLHSIMDKILNKINLKENNISFFLQKCDPTTISAIIQMKNFGAKQIMISACSPNIMNPTIMSQFAKKYQIDQISSPKADAQILEK